ncbi:MAG: sigma-70 family RNA polymerase sigma factor [Chitinophagaceae bacterium]|nr:sigma-70 family RNA polymerase sigma factor [Chitinophagaceae bacterium]
MIVKTQQHIIKALQQPDIEKPVRELYDYYFEGIVAHICANGGSREDGADVFQDAVIVLIEKVKTGRFRGDSSIKTFLSAIARNLWLFELRTRERRKKRELFYMNGENNETTETGSFLDKDSRQDLQKVLAEIGDVCRKLLTGFYYEDKSIKELLAEFDYENEQVLRNKKSKCMKKIKELLSDNSTLLDNLKPLPLYEQ